MVTDQVLCKILFYGLYATPYTQSHGSYVQDLYLSFAQSIAACQTMATSSYCRFPPQPVEPAVRSDRLSSVQCHPASASPNMDMTSNTGNTGIPTDMTSVSLPPLPSSPVPIPGETTTNHGQPGVKAPRISGEAPAGSSSLKPTLSKPVETNSIGSKSRRFSPQLVESTRRSRKSEASGPTILLHDKTDASLGAQEPPSQLLRPSAGSVAPLLPREHPPGVRAAEIPTISESRFSSLRRRKKEPRRHSFRIPDLPSIQSVGESEESNESNNPLVFTSPSADAVDNVSHEQAAQRRKSGSEEPTGYILHLIAQAADEQLREQAMAAYPNEKTHEQVDHFAVAREDSDEARNIRLRSGPVKEVESDSYASRRDSAAGWAVEEMREHHQTFRHSENMKHPIIQYKLMTPRATQEPIQDCTQAAENFSHGPQVAGMDLGASVKDVQMKEMRNAASPPLAGQRLQFPLCQSPRHTRLDAGQPHQERKQTGVDLAKPRSGLWTPGGGSSRKGSEHGLWMGTSMKSVEDLPITQAVAQTGFLTPVAELEDHPTSSPYRLNHLPPSPPASHEELKSYCGDSILSGEENNSGEFQNGFITQVYNYLSLGYPSLARKFDVELSKISKVPIEELRQNDSNMNANGYVGAPEGTGAGKEGTCARWTALKGYVTEWAKQQSHMGIVEEGMNGDWGNRARKGSWAL
jgi:hypothetical protein